MLRRRSRSGAGEEVQPESRNKLSYPPEVGRAMAGRRATEGGGRLVYNGGAVVDCGWLMDRRQMPGKMGCGY